MGLFLDESSTMKKIAEFLGITIGARPSENRKEWETEIDQEVRDESSRKKCLEQLEKDKEIWKKRMNGSGSLLSTKKDSQLAKDMVREIDYLITYTKSKKFSPKK
jgi:hypothetical protein